jgi:hypothetical protein
MIIIYTLKKSPKMNFLNSMIHRIDTENSSVIANMIISESNIKKNFCQDLLIF